MTEEEQELEDKLAELGKFFYENLKPEVVEKLLADDKSIPIEPPVKPATCGRCEDCKFWFVSPEQEEMAEASGEDIELHERCNNEDSFVYSLPTYNYFGCIHFSKLSV